MSKHHRPDQRPQPRQPEPTTPPPGAIWNGIRRLWLDPETFEPVDPQPPHASSGGVAAVPPAVKVTL